MRVLNMNVNQVFFPLTAWMQLTHPVLEAATWTPWLLRFFGLQKAVKQIWEVSGVAKMPITFLEFGFEMVCNFASWL